MTDIEGITSLAMLKMEKNFIAHNEKGYSRQPYKDFKLYDCMMFVRREMKELNEAFDHHMFGGRTNVDRLIVMRNEIADVSNCLDYLYEKVLRAESTLCAELRSKE